MLLAHYSFAQKILVSKHAYLFEPAVSSQIQVFKQNFLCCFTPEVQYT